MLVDSHCHLDFPDFAEERDDVVARAPAAGVGRMVTISTRVQRFAQVLAIAEAYDAVSTARSAPIRTMPPRNSTSPPTISCALPRIPRSSRSARPGSTIITTSRRATRRRQGFRTHIAAARKTGLPLVIHARDADDDIAAILEEETGKGAFPFILHCFSSGRRACRGPACALGGYVSFSGILTFKNSEELRAIAARCAARPAAGRDRRARISRRMPYRGKRNEPAFVVDTAAVLAETIGVSDGRDRRDHHGQFLPPVHQDAAPGRAGA